MGNIYNFFLKLYIAFLFVFLNGIQAFSVEEIDNIPDVIPLQVEENSLQKTIKEQGCVEYSWKNYGNPTGSPVDLFRSSGYTFEKGPIKNQKFRYFFHGGNLFTAKTHEDLSNVTQFIANEVQSETLFADNKTKLMMGFNFSRNTAYDNNFSEKVSFLFLDHRFNENQNFLLGEMRVPVGVEGGIPSSCTKFVLRSQIARTFGNYVSNGIRNTGNYKYMNYDIGWYDASRFFANNFKGSEFATLVSFKPLAKFDDKYGNLLIGGSIDTGHSPKNAYSVFGGHAIYNYKKFYADFEYLYANGNSGIYYGQGRSHGLYSTISYFVHPKVELLARYDFFQNLKSQKVSQEYTAGVNYYLNSRTKLMLNYIYAMNDVSSEPSHKFYIGADFMTSFLLDLL